MIAEIRKEEKQQYFNFYKFQVIKTIPRIVSTEEPVEICDDDDDESQEEQKTSG